MRINVFSLKELHQSSEKYCEKLCPLRQEEFCVLCPESSGYICPIAYYLDKLESGELKQ